MPGMEAIAGLFGIRAKTPPGAIVKIKPSLPGLNEYLFEWHPTTKKVWVINVAKTVNHKGQLRHPAEIIAEFCEDHGRAFGFVQTWCRGFREGQVSPAHLLPPRNLEHV